MNQIGEHIESKRRQIGLSRLQLASRLGVSIQTVLNLERDPAYNLGNSLLRRLEEALHATFEVTMKEEIMSTDITMGDDEFILYIRKKEEKCSLSNSVLGKQIWEWIQGQDPNAEKASEGGVDCMWGESAQNLGEFALPTTATQFTFSRSLLPDLYDMLDQLVD